jgi:hypothetical protein
MKQPARTLLPQSLALQGGGAVFYHGDAMKARDAEIIDESEEAESL